MKNPTSPVVISTEVATLARDYAYTTSMKLGRRLTIKAVVERAIVRYLVTQNFIEAPKPKPTPPAEPTAAQPTASATKPAGA